MSARPQSNSYMPTSKMPTTVNCLRRGSMPAGVTWPCGAISTTLSPTRTPSARASSPPEHDAELARHAGPRACRAACARRCRRPGPPARDRCRASARPARLPPSDSSACAIDVGRGGDDVADCARACAIASPVRQRAVDAADLRCARRRRGCACAAPSGSRSSPTARRSAPPRRARCRPSRSAR